MMAARWRPSPSQIGAVVLIAAVAAVLLDDSSFILYEATLVAIYAVVAVSQDLLFGWAGLVSLGPAAIMAVGAFTTARLSTEGWAVFPLPLVISLVFGAFVGLVIGVPGLRFRGLYLMLTTLALQFVIDFAAQRYQGNREAGFIVNPPHWGSVQLGTPRALFISCAVVLGLVVFILDGLYRARPGRALTAMRQNEGAASVLGIGLVRWRLGAFVASSAVTAVAGSLFAYLSLQVDYATYSLTLGLTLVVMVFIGGTGTITGPIIGAAVVVLLPYGLQRIAADLSSFPSASQWLTLNGPVVADGVYGLVLMLVLLFERDGIFGLLRRLLRGAGHLVERVAGRPGRSDARPASTVERPGLATADSSPPTVGKAAISANGHRNQTPGLLEVHDLSVTYSNGARAVRSVTLSVAPGEIICVLGRNGAGKTSTLRGIGGFLRSERVTVRGSVQMDGKELAGASPARSFGRGIVLVPERDKVFSGLTVDEHLRLTATYGDTRPEDPCAFEALDALRGRRAGLLSGGERQMLALEVAWRSHPRLLLVDELSLGLAPVIVKGLMVNLRELARERNTAMILVEQDAGAALRTADRVYVIRHGEVAWQGASADTSPREVATHYLGTGAEVG
jgi:branched-chain amino acid transport system permease protein